MLEGPRILREDDSGSPSEPIFGGSTTARGAATIAVMLTTEPQTPLDGAVVLPNDPRYDEARSSFNLLVDQRPAAVAFPSDARGVAETVALAERLGLRVAPQATAHNQAPLGDMEDLLLVNVSRLQDIRVDPGARSVRVGAGVKWDRVAPRLSAHGLAGLHGSSPDVGIAGYSLGGGMGWLSRKHGLQTNAVTALELVTADGELIRVDAEHEPDLFWALRGGGGNFGIVTAIEFDVVEIEQLYAGAYFYPVERADEVLHTWNAIRGSFPDELTAFVGFLPTPDGLPAVAAVACYCGDIAEGERILAPLRAFGSPMVDTIQPIPFPVMQTLADESNPDHIQNYWRSTFIETLSDEVIDLIVEQAGRAESPLSITVLGMLGGAIGRVDTGETAFAHRKAAYNIGIEAKWTDPAENARHIAWARGFSERLEPHSRHASMLNFLGDEGPDAVKRAFGQNYEKLVTLKTKYDPTNFFSINQNIVPHRQRRQVAGR